jgi:hypothetical protein
MTEPEPVPDDRAQRACLPVDWPLIDTIEPIAG